jgi:hypothetical protein
MAPAPDKSATARRSGEAPPPHVVRWPDEPCRRPRSDAASDFSRVLSRLAQVATPIAVTNSFGSAGKENQRLSNSINANRPLPQLPSVPNHGNMAQTPTGAHPATGAIVTQIPPSPSPLLSPSPMPEMPPGRAFVASNASRSASNFQKLLANQSKKRKSDVRESARASARNEWKRRTQPNRPTNHNMLGTVVGRAKLGLISGGGDSDQGIKVPLPPLPDIPQRWSPATSPRGSSESSASSTHSSPRNESPRFQMGSRNAERKLSNPEDMTSDAATGSGKARNTDEGSIVSMEFDEVPVSVELVEIKRAQTLTYSTPQAKAPILETPAEVVLSTEDRRPVVEFASVEVERAQTLTYSTPEAKEAPVQETPATVVLHP